MISDSEILERIQGMLARPEMFSQNPASLEDQVVLLLRGYGEEPNTIFNEYLRFTRQVGCGNSTLASKYSEYADLTEKLKLFLETYVLIGE